MTGVSEPVVPQAGSNCCMPVYVLSMLWSSMGGQVSTNASVVCRGGDGTQADFLHLLLPLRSTSVVMGWVWHTLIFWTVLSTGHGQHYVGHDR